MAKKPKNLLEAGNYRATEIDRLLNAFEDLINEQAELLSKELMDSFLDKLEAKNGAVLSSAQNLKKIQLMDQAYSKFQQGGGMKIATTLMSHMDEILLLNDTYFQLLNGGRKVDSDDIKQVIRQRLGIGADGELIRNGYMMGLLDDPSVRNEIRDFAYKNVIGGAGFQDFRSKLRSLVAGDDDRLGVFNRFYRNYAFDTYAQVDATNGAMYAEKLGLKYFIYNGGIMRDKKGKVRSRDFCVKRANKVFSSAEAAKWKDDKDLTAVESKSTYVWQIQRGGYACRHSIDYVSEELAFELRPELENSQDGDPQNMREVDEWMKERGINYEFGQNINDQERLNFSQAFIRTDQKFQEKFGIKYGDRVKIDGTESQNIWFGKNLKVVDNADKTAEMAGEYIRSKDYDKNIDADTLYFNLRSIKQNVNFKQNASDLGSGKMPEYNILSMDDVIAHEAGHNQYFTLSMQERQRIKKYYDEGDNWQKAPSVYGQESATEMYAEQLAGYLRGDINDLTKVLFKKKK